MKSHTPVDDSFLVAELTPCVEEDMLLNSKIRHQSRRLSPNYILISTVINFLFKGCILLSSPHALTDILLLPGMMLLDIIFCIALYCFYDWSIFTAVLTFFLSTIQVLFANVVCSYYLESSSFVDWFILDELANTETISTSMSAFHDYMTYIIFTHSVVLLVMVLGSLPCWPSLHSYLFYKSKRDYTLLPSHQNDNIQTSKFYTLRRGALFILSIWCVIAYLRIPQDTVADHLSENYVITPIFKFVARALDSAPEPEISVDAMASVTKEVPEKLVVEEPKVTHRVSGLKNVMIIFVESLRRDLLEFDEKSYLSEESFPDYKKANHMPFLNGLKRKSMYYHSRSNSAYTIKSILSSICSVYPLTGMTVEHEKPIYSECLPKLLKKLDKKFDSSFMTASDLDFDNMRKLVQSMGYEEASGKEILPGGSNSDNWVNYFGPDDIQELKPIMKKINASVASKSPFFMTYLTNANHHPFNVPKSYEKKKKHYSDDRTIDDYLNSQNYIDTFLENMFGVIRQQQPGVMKDTLFVILGDHGMALGEHGMSGSSQTLNEEGYLVPLMLYSENKAFVEKHVTDFSTPAIEAQNIDILPTVLDLLDYEMPKSTSDLKNEGISLLGDIPPNRSFFSVSNPYNQHGVLLRRGNLKITYELRSKQFRMYDLKVDPQERFSLAKTLSLSEAHQKWFVKAKARIRLWLRAIKKKWQHNEYD